MNCMQHIGPPRLSLTPPEFAQTHVHWVKDVIQPSHPLSPPLLLPSIFPSTGVFSNVLALRIRWLKYWSFSISPSNESWGWFPLGWLISSPCYPRDSQESSPAPQLESISSWVLSLHYGPTLSPGHDYGKNHSSDTTGLCWQSDVPAVCCAVLSHSVVSSSLQTCGLYPTRLFCPRRFFRQEHWSGLPCPPPGDLPNPEDRTQVSLISGRFFIIWAIREAQEYWSG